MDIEKMTLEQVVERLTALSTEIRSEGADLDALTKEIDSLEARKKELVEFEQRKKQAEDLSKNPSLGKVVGKQEGTSMEERFDANSKEYRNAFLKTLMGRELTEEERTAFVHTTGTTSGQSAGNVMPTEMVNRIWDLVEEQHAILDDISIYKTGTVIEIPMRTAIAAGDAGTVSEAAAPSDDENNTFAKVTLAGKDFAKTVEISYALSEMSIDGFEDYLVNEIAERMGAALASDVVTQILTDYYSTGNALDVTTSGTLLFKEVAGAFAVLKNAKDVVVYANRTTIYKYLVGMVDTAGRPIFQLTAQDGVEGYLIGAPVKVEDAVTDDILLIGDPKQVVGNMVTDIMVEADKDIKKHVKIYSGYARFGCKLLASKAFATLDVTP